jgi:hypothetical protein
MKPDHPLAIRAYDYMAAAAFGAGSALSVSLLVPDSLPLAAAMLAAMVVGVLSALPLLGLFTVLLGGFEILMMSVQIGMIAGMAGVMARGEPLGTAVLRGVVTGLVIQFLLHLADLRLHGPVKQNV